ncbi:fatty acid oxidation complex subunit alpha FadB [Photobacterium gaetbulicola]|uniref:enoyl-CoA hydratase n=1 Tax=Photobacterium gaetbulicola Gung47 TaxID=658445 RepID=A0A0C5WMT5_9GAMM|nr:fatty acid oxidation complex subunit alpha FadB [Photobacterium gaetbulicola]AJR06374.1 putative fatty oxidation complex, alpha subunit [Photobacterium gaetbulicola Gung47]PSU05472.1 fatty acid oxidation complex subunit alpha FadB [Photobacterium gaetbulicola]
MYQGQSFQIVEHGKYAELVFNDQQDKVNTLRDSALKELEACAEVLQAANIDGLVIRSDKPLFSAGADIKAFRGLFAAGEAAIEDYLSWVHSVYSRIEDLPYPKVAIINGVAAGGGVELSMLAEYRLATTDVKISLPEVKLGIMPGYGGTTRLPRIVGLDTSLQWLTTGKNFKAEKAMEQRFVDGVIDPTKVNAVEEAIAVLDSCVAGDLNWQARQAEKKQPLPLSQYEQMMSISVARGMAFKVAGKQYPAPHIILDTVEKAATIGRDEALAVERKGIAKCAASGVADALVSVFLSDMHVKAKTRSFTGKSDKTAEIGVIGAGIMGGGIAYVSADRNIDVVMKDINKSGLQLGLSEANKLLSKQVDKGRKSASQMGDVLNRIQPTLHDAALESTDLIIEAVVENPKVKEIVLAGLENAAPNAVIASNTSTLMISGLAKSLKRPENFCGIHFFNPVHRMPLVEVIRGEQTSDETVAKAVRYVEQLGKTPIVVNDCGGFLVNRCLTPYMLAFNQLVLDGGDIAIIDKTMSKSFGWPMGPAHLTDVIGLDTAEHCVESMDAAFPGRLGAPEVNLFKIMVENQRLGQKNGAGFYNYVADRRGRVKPSTSETALSLISGNRKEAREFDADTITMRLMLPMMFEIIRCLDEGIVASPQEADIAMIYGTGFPPFRGGLFYYMDQIGLPKLVEIARQYEQFGPLYALPEGLLTRAENGETFY